MYDFVITAFDCQGGSQGRGVSAMAFALAGIGVALHTVHYRPTDMSRKYNRLILFIGVSLYRAVRPTALRTYSTTSANAQPQRPR